MPTCKKCGKSYRGEPGYCEPCDEFKKQLRKEESGVFCYHCGDTFTEKEWDQHRWRIFYRLRDLPIGRRQRR